MKVAGWITLFYGLIIMIGGVIGHVQAASTPSLVAGILFGILLLMSSVGMLKNQLFPAYIGVLLILILDAFFTYRFLFTYQFIPAGLMSILSLIVLIAVVLTIRKHLKIERKP